MEYEQKVRITPKAELLLIDFPDEALVSNKSIGEFYRKIGVNFRRKLLKEVTFGKIYMEGTSRKILYESIRKNATKHFRSRQFKQMAERRTDEQFMDYGPSRNDYIDENTLVIVLKGEMDVLDETIGDEL